MYLKPSPVPEILTVYLNPHHVPEILTVYLKSARRVSRKLLHEPEIERARAAFSDRSEVRTQLVGRNNNKHRIKEASIILIIDCTLAGVVSKPPPPPPATAAAMG